MNDKKIAMRWFKSGHSTIKSVNEPKRNIKRAYVYPIRETVLTPAWMLESPFRKEVNYETGIAT